MPAPLNRISIVIHPFFLLTAGLIGWLNTMNIVGTIVWMVVIFISILVHEYGHALTAIAFGQGAEINLVALGGLTKRNGGKLALWKEFLIVLDGPLAGFLLCGIAYLLSTWVKSDSVLLKQSLQVAIFINFFWTIVNLLPIHPLDGGQLLAIVLEGVFGVRGYKAALFISFLLGLAISIAFFAYHMVLAGALFTMLTFESFRNWQDSLAMTRQDQNLELQKMMDQAEHDIVEKHFDEATKKLQHIRQETQQGILYNRATQMLAKLMLYQEHPKESYDLIMSQNKEDLSPDLIVILHKLAFNFHDWNTVTEIGNRCFQEKQTEEVALANAIAHAAKGNTKNAIGWLSWAKQADSPNLKQTILRPEFDGIRSSCEMQAFLKTRKCEF